MQSRWRKTLFLCFLVLWSVTSIPSLEAANVRSAPALQSVWAKLDAAREYRKDWRGLGGSIPKTHGQLIKDYKEKPVPGYEPRTPQQLFLEAANAFRSFLQDHSLQEEAMWGLQESQNEYMTGQLLIGNDDLIKGLRVRFPGAGDPEDPDQLTLLTLSAQEFQNGIDQIIEDLRTNPTSMRAGGIANPQFPFFVENTVAQAGRQGELVENELYRLTNLVDRLALASNSKGKRMFFHGNVKDVDNFPFGNFKGTEDLDLNGNGILDAAGREDAALQLKRSAHAAYLHTAILAAVQTEKEFDQNNGYQLKRQVLDAQRVFDDIRAGLNPLRLLGDFVPRQRVENYLNLARNVIGDAITAERAAKAATRLYDQDETALRQTLESQQLTFLDSIAKLTGLSNIGTAYNLPLPEERERLLADAKSNAEQGKGQLGLQKLVRDEASIAVLQAFETLRQIPEKIRIEEERNNQISKILMENGTKLAALSLAESIASSVTICECGLSTGVLINLQSIILGAIRGQRDILSAIQQSQIQESNSSATIKQLLLDQALALISVQRANKIVEQENARLDEFWADLERTVRNYVASRSDLTKAYFANPAYRLDRDQLIEAAETSFEAAMEEAYRAAKALEYLWSEKFNNPVNELSGGNPVPLSPIHKPYVRAESVFVVKFAEIKEPNLDQFLDAMEAWDVKMRDLRTPQGQTRTVEISLRRNILGYAGPNEAQSRLLFRDFLARHRVKGLNPNNPDLLFEFALEIGDEKLFPDFPNIKIQEIQMNLVSVPQRSIAAGRVGTMPALVDLIMLDEASVRSFFADFPTDDDLLIYDLEEGRTLEKSPFIATVEATIDGSADPLPTPNTQLADHSPAVTRWALRIKMSRGSNQDLKLEFLGDIELTIKYHSGVPRQVNFPPSN